GRQFRQYPRGTSPAAPNSQSRTLIRSSSISRAHATAVGVAPIPATLAPPTEGDESTPANSRFTEIIGQRELPDSVSHDRNQRAPPVIDGLNRPRFLPRARPAQSGVVGSDVDYAFLISDSAGRQERARNLAARGALARHRKRIDGIANRLLSICASSGGAR